MEIIEKHASFGGSQEVYRHQSIALNCSMKFSIYLPPHDKDERLPVLYWLSGLTCNEQNFITKAGAQKYAAEHKVIIVAPDTSPRGEDVPDHADYDLGQGAGFYVNATQAPWSQHFKMYDYIVEELRNLIDLNFPTNQVQSIMGHSMGGHGALVIGLKNPELYKSISAFAPIVADAIKFKGKHDPNFIINADVGDRRRFFEGSHLTINAELNKEAFVSVLGWYPDIDKENYYKLFPNEFDKNNFLQNRFKIPTRSNSARYKLDISFPLDFKKDETQEFIIVLATKRKFAILNKIKVSELLTRLDDEGKSNWYMQKIGYSVLRKK